MDKIEIGANANKVWQLVSDNQTWSYQELKKETGLKDKELGAALGWLAREEKVELERMEDDINVYHNVNIYIG